MFAFFNLLLLILDSRLSLTSPTIATKRSAPHLSALAEHLTRSRDAPTSFKSIQLSELPLCQQYFDPTPRQTPEERTLHVNSSTKPTERQNLLVLSFSLTHQRPFHAMTKETVPSGHACCVKKPTGYPLYSLYQIQSLISFLLSFIMQYGLLLMVFAQALL